MKKLFLILLIFSTSTIYYGQTFTTKNLFYNLPIDKTYTDLIAYVKSDSSFKITADNKAGLDFCTKIIKPLFDIQPEYVNFSIRPMQLFYDSSSFLSITINIEFNERVGRRKTGKIYQKIYDSLKNEYALIKKEEDVAKQPLKDGSYEIVALLRNFFYLKKDDPKYQFDMTWLYVCKKCNQSINFTYRLKEKTEP